MKYLDLIICRFMKIITDMKKIIIIIHIINMSTNCKTETKYCLFKHNKYLYFQVQLGNSFVNKLLNTFTFTMEVLPSSTFPSFLMICISIRFQNKQKLEYKVNYRIKYSQNKQKLGYTVTYQMNKIILGNNESYKRKDIL